MKKNIGILIVFISICLFFFRPYFFSNKILFPSNLLVSFYAPWNTIKFPGWEQGVPFKGLGHDNLLIFYPMKELLRQAITEKSFPLWNPYNFSGSPYFGDGQSALMYPFTWIYALFPLPDAFSMMVILVPFLTLIFTYGLLRHFKVSFTSSIFGAITFAFSGFMSVWMEENPAVSHSAIWLPLLIWTADLLLTAPNRLRFFLFSIITGIMMASGFLQISMYELLFTAVFILYRILTSDTTYKKRWQRFGLIMLAGIIGLLIVAPYLATTWEAYRLSPREFVQIPEIRSIYLVSWSHIISLFNPDWLGNPGTYNYHNVGTYYDKILFIGVVPLVFVLLKIFLKKSKLEKFFLYSASITMFFGFSSPFTQWLFAQPIPILSSMLPSRIFYLSTFALSVFAAFGFEHLKQSTFYKQLPNLIRRISVLYLFIIIILEVFLLAYLTEINLPSYQLGSIAHTIRENIVPSMKVSFDLPSILLRNITISCILTMSTLILLLISMRIHFMRVILPGIIIVITVFSAWYFSNKSYYFGERKFVFPQSPLITELSKDLKFNRIAFADERSRLKSALNVQYRLYSPEGLNPVFAHRYGQLIKAVTNGGMLTNTIPRISVDLDLKTASTDATVAAMTKRLISLLGISRIVENKTDNWYSGVYTTHKIIWQNDFYRLWENPESYPRAFMVPQVATIADPQRSVDRMFDPDTNLRTVAVIEKELSLPTEINSSLPESVVITSYQMNDMTLDVQTPRSGLLFISDTYAPGWRALVDGKPTEVYRTNFIFRGIPITAGSHTVKVFYQPQSLTYGIFGMIGGVILLFLSLIAFKYISYI